MTSPQGQAFIDQLPLFDAGRDMPEPALRRQHHATADIPTRANLNAGHKKPNRPPHEAAAAFIQANPQAWAMFCQFALQLVNAGRERIGAKAIFERMRWETMVKTKSDDGFKLNNNHTAHFARQFMQQYPEAGKLFSTRKVSKSLHG